MVAAEAEEAVDAVEAVEVVPRKSFPVEDMSATLNDSMILMIFFTWYFFILFSTRSSASNSNNVSPSISFQTSRSISERNTFNSGREAKYNMTSLGGHCLILLGSSALDFLYSAYVKPKKIPVRTKK